MNKYFKKGLTILGAAGAVVAPVAAIVSCGSKISRYDMENDGKLSIAATFSATGVQTKALQAIIEQFNNHVDSLRTTNNAKGYMKINDLVTISGGYGKVMSKLRKDFTAKNKKNLYNLMVDYPSSAAILKEYKMELNLNDVMSQAGSAALKAKFAADFWKINDNIGGLAAGGTYAIPVSVSSSASAVNAPLFRYIVDQVNKVKAKAIDTSVANPKIKEIYDLGNVTGDLTSIGTKWGTMTNVKGLSDLNKYLNSHTIDDSIFNEWDTLIDFLSAVQNAFGIKANDSRQMHLLTLDSPTNVIQMLSYAYADGDMSKFYITKGRDGYVEYNFLEDKNSDSYKNFEKGIDLLRKGVESGALWIGGIGAYGSSLLVNHQSMISVGSTAGASHWYVGKDGSYKIKGGAVATVLDASDAKMTFNNGKITFTSGSHTNKILENGGSGSRYDVYLKKGYSLAQFKTDATGGKKWFVKVEKDNVADFETKMTGKFVMVSEASNGAKYYLLNSSEVEKLSSDDTVQSNEVIGIIPPTKVHGKSKGSVYLQGPSFIPIHANGPEDKAIALFVEWFMSQKIYDWSKINKDNSKFSTTPMTPVSYWLEKANYIVPTTNAFKNNSAVKGAIDAGLKGKASKYWKGVKVTWENFNLAENDANVSPIILPVDGYTSIARNQVTDIAIKGIYTEAHKSGSVESFDDIYASMELLARSANIV